MHENVYLNMHLQAHFDRSKQTVYIYVFKYVSLCILNREKCSEEKQAEQSQEIVSTFKWEVVS